MTISYLASKDELVLKLRPLKAKASKEFGRFRLWWDKEDNICAIAIRPFTEELKEFEQRHGWIHLSGIWKGVNIEVEDIKESRQELLMKLEERGEKY